MGGLATIQEADAEATQKRGDMTGGGLATIQGADTEPPKKEIQFRGYSANGNNGGRIRDNTESGCRGYTRKQTKRGEDSR